MPVPEFEWSTYEVPVPAAAESAAPAETMTIQLPDLSPWPSPLDKAKILLDSAAEVEHALMVQYLYAGYSLKSSDEVTDPAQQEALDDSWSSSWPQVLLGIAREEMGHLLTVQNLLLLLGLAPNLEREDFPPRKDLYPFSLHLERLSQRSLAKYVVAEAPADAEGIEDIAELATESAGTTINRVGVLYGLLGLIFTRGEDVKQGGSGSAEWDETVLQLSDVAYRQSPANSWHLPDSAFDPLTIEQQGDPEDWQVGELRVHRMADRAAALQAIRDIGEQGEGPTNGGAQSHFEKFLGIYRGRDGTPPFPAAGGWEPTREVPTDPQADVEITEPDTRRWAELVDIRYALLLGFLEHYLMSVGDRTVLTGWIFAEMRSRIGVMARRLTTMPRDSAGGSAVAAAPFRLPSLLHPPDTEPARWAIHKERTEAAIAKVEELRSPDRPDPYLTALLASDRARLAFIDDLGMPDGTTSFARDILPLFRPKDVEHMLFRMDLGEYESVRGSAQKILKRVQGSGGQPMPPIPDQRWTRAQVDLFKRWIDDGFPE